MCAFQLNRGRVTRVFFKLQRGQHIPQLNTIHQSGSALSSYLHHQITAWNLMKRCSKTNKVKPKSCSQCLVWAGKTLAFSVTGFAWRSLHLHINTKSMMRCWGIGIQQQQKKRTLRLPHNPDCSSDTVINTTLVSGWCVLAYRHVFSFGQTASGKACDSEMVCVIKQAWCSLAENNEVWPLYVSCAAEWCLWEVAEIPDIYWAHTWSEWGRK